MYVISKHFKAFQGLSGQGERRFRGLHRISGELFFYLFRGGSVSRRLQLYCVLEGFRRVLGGFTGSWVSFTGRRCFRGISTRNNAFQGVQEISVHLNGLQRFSGDLHRVFSAFKSVSAFQLVSEEF